MRQAGGVLRRQANQLVLVVQANFKPAGLVSCHRLRGKADNPKEALCSWNSDSALTPMSLEEIYSPLAVEIVCLPFPSLQK